MQREIGNGYLSTTDLIFSIAMRKALFFTLLAAFVGGNIAFAQVSLPPETATRVKNEGLNNSKVEEIAQFMTDHLGSRLTASQQKRRAEKEVMGKLNEFGLSNVHSEFAYAFPRGGWDVVKTYAAMTSPYYCAFTVNPKAWSGSTNGLVRGECIVLDIKTKDDIEKYRGKLSGKVVLMPVTQTYTISFEPLAERYTEEQLESLVQDRRANTAVSPAGPPRTAGLVAGQTMSREERMELQRLQTELLKSEKPLCVVTGRGTFNVVSGTGVSYTVGDPEPTPEVMMPIEDHGRMVRMIQNGEKVEMELELINKFTDDQEVHNVFAEIPGTDPKLKDEIVMIGAHLDSWHGGTGGADNASGCISMIEAMRILKAMDVKPKRTIRLALWGGEEQGLYGSRGYMETYLYKDQKKLPGFDKFALYLNMDNGSGRFRGIYLEGNDAAFPFFEAWKKYIEPLGFQYLSPRSTGSTDHVSFLRAGLPAYQFIQDELEYNRTYHTIMDTYERLSLGDLKLDATIIAWLALCAAEDPGRIPVNATANGR